jgi:hypothetical protein
MIFWPAPAPTRGLACLAAIAVLAAGCSRPAPPARPLRIGLHSDPLVLDPHLRDARLLMKVDDHEDAARKLARVLELIPGHPAAQALLEQARAARKRQPEPPAAGGKPRPKP